MKLQELFFNSFEELIRLGGEKYFTLYDFLRCGAMGDIHLDWVNKAYGEYIELTRETYIRQAFVTDLDTIWEEIERMFGLEVF